MRRNRRSGHGGHEFGGSGEDSFVAVVVTKLTGALLFILLLTMVIMALLPKAVDLPSSGNPEGPEAPPLAITTPETLPEAIAGHPYTLALAATGAKGPMKWSTSQPLPEGLSLDEETGVLKGTPAKGTPKPAEFVVRVSDGTTQDAGALKLTIYQSDKPLSTPVWWKPGIPPIPWQAWLEQGFGFLVLMLVHMVGMNTVASLQRWSLAALDAENADAEDLASAKRRFMLYRLTVRVAGLSAAAILVVWLVRHRG